MLAIGVSGGRFGGMSDWHDSIPGQFQAFEAQKAQKKLAKLAEEQAALQRQQAASGRRTSSETDKKLADLTNQVARLTRLLAESQSSQIQAGPQIPADKGGPCVTCGTPISFNAPTCPTCSEPGAGSKVHAAASEELRSALGIDGNEETLNLSHKEIGDLSPVVKNALTGLTQLTELNLSSNELTDVSALVGLTQLTSLDLWSNELTDVNALAGLTQLTSLNLCSNELTDVSALAGLTQLTELDLGFNELTDEWVEWIKKALPKCDIRFRDRIALQPRAAQPPRLA